MKHKYKRKIVIGLETICGLTRHRWCNALTGLAIRLDKRWAVGVWPKGPW